MDFGMPTLIELPTPEACAALCHDLGLQFLELNMNLPQYQVETIDVLELRKISQEYGIYYTIHLDENLDPCNFNAKIANAWTQTALDTIEIAKQLNVPILNMHLNRGVYFTLPDRKIFLYEQEKDRYLAALRSFRHQITQAVGSCGVRICIENTDGYDQSFLQDGLSMLLESPVFALTLDTGHDAAIGGRDQHSILQYPAQLIHMHLHDCLGKKAHLPLGEGEIDLASKLTLANENHCRVVLETKTVAGLKRSVQWLKTTL